MLVELKGAKSAEEAMKLAGLDWNVEEASLLTGNGIDVDSHKALFRSDNRQILGVVGKHYEPIQNTTAFAFFDVVVEQYGASYEYAGIIKGGSKIFLQAKLKRSFDAAPGDKVDSYITLVTTHDGSASLRAFLTPIRLFCQNQLIRAIKSATTNVNLRHSSNANDRLQEALKVFQMSMFSFQVFEDRAKYLAQKLVDRQMVDRFLKEILGDSRSTRAREKREKVFELFQYGKGNTGRSAWHLYNAAAEYVDHKRSADTEKALDSGMFGSGALLKGMAFEAAMRL
jgi:phage/plasmid-like protein (TIGR03299 family)